MRSFDVRKNSAPAQKDVEGKPCPDGVIRVWLVEDNERFRSILTRILKAVPMLTCCGQYANAEDPVKDLADGARVDVILLDIELPRMNGVMAVRRIKSVSPSTQVIMLTVSDNHAHIFAAISGGATGYLLKSSSSQQIVEAIGEVHAGGAPMTPRIARSVLEAFAGSGSSQEMEYGLTSRERTILELMVQGLIKKEIAASLTLSYHTVDTHLRNIYTKLHVRSRTTAVAKALRERLV